MTGDSDKSSEKASSPSAGSQPSSGEGAETALQALIKKRSLRAEDDSPSAADSGNPEPASP